jgi:excisionase family DNA binding protein
LAPSDRDLPEDARLLTAREAADYLRLSLGTVYNMVSKGRLRPGRAGNRLRFRREDLDRYLWGRD